MGGVGVGLGAAKWPEGGHQLCECRGERGALGGQEPSDEKGEGAIQDSQGLALFGWVGCSVECVSLCTCASGNGQFSAMDCGQTQAPRANQRGDFSLVLAD